MGGHPLLEQCLRRGRPPDPDLRLGAKAGREEHQPLDVVQVEVGEQDVDPGSRSRGSRPGAPGFPSRRRAAAARRCRAGPAPKTCCRRSDSSPAPVPGPSRAPPQTLTFMVSASPRPSSVGQNRTIAPEDPSSEATIGNALDAISRSATPAERMRNTACAGLPSRTAYVVKARVVEHNRLAVLAERPMGGDPLLRAHPANVLEQAPRRGPRGLVVEHQDRILIDEEGRRREGSSAGCGPGSAPGASGRERPSGPLSHHSTPGLGLSKGSPAPRARHRGRRRGRRCREPRGGRCRSRSPCVRERDRRSA